ncbi:MAG: VOC family protein [Ramlibacter sp.]
MSIATSLRPPVTLPESRLPATVERLLRPPAAGRAVSLAFLRWEKKSLGATARFWSDFGFAIASATAERVVARGTAAGPCLAVASRGAADRFVGPAFAMSNDTDLAAYERAFGGRWLDAAQLPAGGRGIEVLDPSGRPVWLLQGQDESLPLPNRAPVHPLTNTAAHTARVNAPVRTPIEPARVVRLGHLVLQTVDFAGMANWYMRVLGLIPTDVQYLADGSPALAFMRLDMRDTPADHHTLVLVGALEERYEHSAYEVVDLDALGQGQQVLRAHGWRHLWGIGRHVLGSQLFDYWQDPDGFEYEHYTDGDVFTADVETGYTPLEFGSLWAWGPDAPASLKPARNLRTLLRILRLLRDKRITLQRLKLLAQAMDAPARPWS